MMAVTVGHTSPVCSPYLTEAFTGWLAMFLHILQVWDKHRCIVKFIPSGVFDLSYCFITKYFCTVILPRCVFATFFGPQIPPFPPGTSGNVTRSRPLADAT